MLSAEDEQFMLRFIAKFRAACLELGVDHQELEQAIDQVKELCGIKG